MYFLLYFIFINNFFDFIITIIFILPYYIDLLLMIFYFFNIEKSILFKLSYNIIKLIIRSNISETIFYLKKIIFIYFGIILFYSLYAFLFKFLIFLKYFHHISSNHFLFFNYIYF